MHTSEPATVPDYVQKKIHHFVHNLINVAVGCAVVSKEISIQILRLTDLSQKAITS